MKHHPDDRRDNVKKIQHTINKTIQNFHAAEEMIDETDDNKLKKALKGKNVRRKEALNGLRSEIKDEALHQKKQLE